MPRRVRSIPSKRLQLVVLLLFTTLLYFYSRWRESFSNRRHSLLKTLTSPSPLPVHHIPSLIHFHNHPVSSYRPSADQFDFNFHSKKLDPVVQLITAAYNPRPVLLETAQSIRHQSLTNFEWVIVNDHTTDPESIALLNYIAQDPRVTILKNLGIGGLPVARNVGLEYALSKGKKRPRYVVCIDDDDLFELTALEKLVWMLESNPQWDMAGYPFVKFGDQNLTEARGFHNGKDNYAVGNFIPNAAVFTSSAVARSGCRYDEVNFGAGGEDWDIWMCFAEAGIWGGTLPELLYWYRVNPSAFRNARWGNTFVDGFAGLHAKVKQKHSTLQISGDSFPLKFARPSGEWEPIRWDPPYASALDVETRKGIVFIVPWLEDSVAGRTTVRTVQLFVEAGYRVTVVCTYYKNPQGLELKPFVLMWTHDLHILPTFLRANDMPRYLKHLIRSRGATEVIISQSALAYELLPVLTEQLPEVRFIDYLHDKGHDDVEKMGDFSSYSTISQRHLTRTIVSSDYLKRSLVENGHSASRIGVVKLGLDLADYTPASNAERETVKREVLGIEKEMLVITIIARMESSQRVLLIPEIAQGLIRLGAKNFLIVVIGEGEELVAMRGKIASLRLERIVRVLSKVESVKQYYVATDVFCSIGLSEGISGEVAEAMAMALPIVAGRSGALPEQLGAPTSPSTVASVTDLLTDEVAGVSSLRFQTRRSAEGLGGILVESTSVDTVDSALYADALFSLLVDQESRSRYGQRGRELTVDWRITLNELFKELKIAERTGEENEGESETENPTAHFAIRNLLLEQREGTDFAAFQATMDYKERFGFGLELQKVCGEATDNLVQWIDAVTAPIACPSNPGLSFINFGRSVALQCGAWCILDLTTPAYIGWTFDGVCFSSITTATWCQKHFLNHRPDVILDVEVL